MPAPRPFAAAWWFGPAVCIAAAALLAVGAYAGVAPSVAAAALISGLLINGWATLLELPARRGTAVTLALVTVLVLTAVGLTRTDPLLDWLALAVASSVLACFGHQLLRRDGRPRLVESLSGELMGTALLASLACLVALPRLVGGPQMVLVLAAAMAALSATYLVPLPERTAAALGVVAATAAGALAGIVAPHTDSIAGALLGLVTSLVGAALRRIFLAQPTSGEVAARLVVAIAPLAAGGIVTYVVARLFLG